MLDEISNIRLTALSVGLQDVLSQLKVVQFQQHTDNLWRPSAILVRRMLTACCSATGGFTLSARILKAHVKVDWSSIWTTTQFPLQSSTQKSGFNFESVQVDFHAFELCEQAYQSAWLVGVGKNEIGSFGESKLCQLDNARLFRAISNAIKNSFASSKPMNAVCKLLSAQFPLA